MASNQGRIKDNIDEEYQQKIFSFKTIYRVKKFLALFVKDLSEK